MACVFSRMVMAAAIVCVTAAGSLAQQTQTAVQETKAFEVLAVDGNKLVVRLPEGTKELTVADDFRFNINGRMMSVRELKPAMKGTAVITTRTTSTPVTVTEVKNGTVVVRSGSNLIVRTDEGVKMFTQGDVDKRGVKIMREGQPAELSQFREGDRLTATIITSGPPKVMTEQDVKATLAASTASTPARAATAPASTASTAKPATAATARPAPAARSTQSTAAAAGEAAPTATSGGRLPATASSWPLFGVASIMLLVTGAALTIRRRFAR